MRVSVHQTGENSDLAQVLDRAAIVRPYRGDDVAVDGDDPARKWRLGNRQNPGGAVPHGYGVARSFFSRVLRAA